LAIAASTGGPPAPAGGVPRPRGGLPTAVLVVQHMPPRLPRSPPRRANNMSALRVGEGHPGPPPLPPTAGAGPGEYHMRVAAGAEGGGRVEGGGGGGGGGPGAPARRGPAGLGRAAGRRSPVPVRRRAVRPARGGHGADRHGPGRRRGTAGDP